MPGGQIWANVRLTEGDLRILGRFLGRTGRSWDQLTTEAVRAYLREAEAQAEGEGTEEALEGAEEGEAITHKRRLLESWGAPMPTLGEAPEGAPREDQDREPSRGFALLEAARRAHPR